MSVLTAALSTLLLAVPVPPARDAAPGAAPAVSEPARAERFELGALLQGWGFFERAGAAGCLDSSCAANRSTMRLRRAELRLSGEVLPDTLSYRIMIDPARALEMKETVLRVAALDEDGRPVPGELRLQQPSGAITVLQDVTMTWRADGFDVTLGQFKIPVSWEGCAISSSKLLFPERSLVAREFGDARDLGVRFSARLGALLAIASVYNGAGQNTLDTDNAKDAALRLVLTPVEGVGFALATYDTVGQRHLPGTRDRWEASTHLERGPLYLHTELIRARDRVRAGEGGVVHSWGATAAVGWTFAGRLQPALRYSRLDPMLGRDVDPVEAKGADELHSVEAAVSLLFPGTKARLQLGWQSLLFEQRAAAHRAVLVGQLGF